MILPVVAGDYYGMISVFLIFLTGIYEFGNRAVRERVLPFLLSSVVFFIVYLIKFFLFGS